MIYAEERYNNIMRLLTDKGRISSAELSSALNISRETIRRDLNRLAQEGRLVKTRGGAILPDASLTSLDFPYTAREKANRTEKSDLCAYAARFIQERDTIFLDNSSTVTHLIRFIPKQYPLNFLVYSISLLLTLSNMHNPNWNVFSLGGMLSYTTMSSTRTLALSALDNFMPSKAFLSCHSITRDFYATDSYMEDVELKRRALDISAETFLLADASKLNHPGVIKVASSVEFDHIITNEKAAPFFVNDLRENGCNIHLAPHITK